MSYHEDTIFALSTARGRAGIAVIRLSGAQSLPAAARLAGRDSFSPRTAHLVTFSEPETGAELDRGLVLWFPAPGSFSGEDMAEFHIHGGFALIDLFMDALGKMAGLRPAEPGEFTRRAFENGKMDLTAAEGLGDLILAETRAQHRQALRQMKGALGEIYEDWRRRLIASLAYLEADIDFADEDLPENLADGMRPVITKIHAEITTHLAAGQRSERLRSGLIAVILGAPNVGKSSLLNRLARDDVAIVSDIAGTTRDAIEVRLDLGGYPVTLIDTAGLREARDAIEREGVRRALAKAEGADIRIILGDATGESGGAPDLGDLPTEDAFFVVNKSDLVDRRDLSGFPKSSLGVFSISAKSGAGLDAFLQALEKEVVKRLSLSESPGLTRQRHRRALEECIGSLRQYLGTGEKAPELLAEDIRLAARALGRITGQVDVERILDVIFADFCIGK